MIAGADGEIGSYLMESFENKYNIMSTSFYDSDNKYTFSGDFTSLDVVERIATNFEKSDVLIFLIGLAHAKGKGKDLSKFNKVNYQTVVNLLTALSKVGKTPNKIIFASTISIYGERYDKDIYTEEVEPRPFSPYAISKRQAEQFLLDNFGNNSWILRFAPVYSHDFLLNIERRTKLRGTKYKVGKRTKKLSLCNIENIKAAIEGIIDGAAPAGTYNISDPIAYTYNDLLSHQGVSFVFRIPALAIRFLYILGRITNNIFLKENSTKLITDNIFPSEKIQKYIKFSSTISDLKIPDD